MTLDSNVVAAVFAAVCSVESGGDANAYNAAEDAVGIAQIRRCVVRDLPGWRMADRWNAVYSAAMFREYMAKWCKHGTAEEMARVWNGGPRGMRKAATKAYWQKVRARMATGAITGKE